MPLELSDSARSLLRLRYLRRDEEGRIIETEEELFWRVARAVAAAEDAFPRGPRSAEIAEKFYELMTDPCAFFLILQH
jgi:ribonucleoside-diphosphate reductase alpha chain